MTNVWALIPAHRPSLGHFPEVVEILGLDLDHVLVVANGEHPPTEYETGTPVLHDRTEGVNISRWWNLGLDWIEKTEGKRDGTVNDHYVLILNADARIGVVGVARLAWALDQHRDAVMAGPMRGNGVIKETRPEPLGLEMRIPGYCFMLRGSPRIRADERYRWWCGDDSLEWEARRNGGTLLVGPIEFRHLGDGMPRGHLMDLAKEDVVRFEEQWGIRPW